MTSLFRRLCRCLLVVSTIGTASSQQVMLKDLSVGTRAGEIGLVNALNEECRGPATIMPSGQNTLAILDRVNSKIVLLEDAGNREVPLPTHFLEPVDFILTSVGFLVVGAMATLFQFLLQAKLSRQQSRNTMPPLARRV